jgi:copper homeostasis protein
MPGSLEIPLDSLQVALLAAPHADRLELCHDLSSEGWSPSPDLVREVRRSTPCEVVAMIRPRVPGMLATLEAAAFVGTPAFRQACLADIEAAADAGAHTVAIGMLDDLGDIDLEGCHRLCEAASRRRLRTSFHRAFDLLVDRDRGWRDAMALGLCRVLTAGVQGWNAAVTPLRDRVALLQRESAALAELSRTLGAAAPEVVACGGVRAAHATDWLAATPHLHASCRVGGAFVEAELRSLRDAMGAPAAFPKHRT